MHRLSRCVPTLVSKLLPRPRSLRLAHPLRQGRLFLPCVRFGSTSLETPSDHTTARKTHSVAASAGSSRRRKNPFLRSAPPDVRSFWQALYDTGVEATLASKVLSVGPLLHRENRLQRNITPNLFVRDVYGKLHDFCQRTDRQHYFFTGTSGIGKSCFRTYMMWRNIQELKRTGGTGFVWAGRSPEGKSMVHGLHIKDGKILDAYTIRSADSDLAEDWLESERIKAFAHLDVSLGDVSAAPSATNFTIFYYTSPNENAWKEKIKIDGSVMCIPEWEIDELLQFYRDMGCNGVMLRRLGLDVTEKRFFKLSLLSDPHRESAAHVSPDEVAHVSEEQLKRVIEEETRKYGRIPRNLFMSKDNLAAFAVSIRSGIANLEKTTSSADLVGFMKNARHRLLMSINPLSDCDDFSEYTTTWTGTFVYNAVVEHILKVFNQDVKNNFLAGGLNNIFRGDPKMFEILSLGYFAHFPEHFRIEPIPNSETPGPSPIISKDITFFVDPDRKDLNLLRGFVRSATNLEMMEFAADLARRGIVSPLKQEYPGIDGIARFGYGNRIYTAFIQVNIAQSHEFGPEAAALLRELRTLAETATVPDNHEHRCILMWLVDKKNKKPKSLDTKLQDRQEDRMDEYVVLIDV